MAKKKTRQRVKCGAPEVRLFGAASVAWFTRCLATGPCPGVFTCSSEEPVVPSCDVFVGVFVKVKNVEKTTGTCVACVCVFRTFTQ